MPGGGERDRLCEHVFVSIKGSPQLFFRRSIEQGNALNAWGAAHELGRLSLGDALALSLVVLDGDRPRYGRLAVRWTGRLVTEAGGLDLDDLALTAAALAALRGEEAGPAAATLAAVLERRGEHGARQALEAWGRRRGA